MAHVVSGSFIEQTVISTSWGDVDLLFAHHVVEFIRINTCRVYDVTRLICALACPDLPAVFHRSQVGDFCIKVEFHAVRVGILRHSDI